MSAMREGISDVQFRDWAGKVAAELGMHVARKQNGGWGLRITDGTRSYHLDKPAAHLAGGRVEITPVYPQTGYTFSDRHGPRGRIGVSFGRPPADVAADINRRLRPVYDETLPKVEAYNAQAKAEGAARRKLAAKITRLFPDGAVSENPYSQRGGYVTELNVHGPAYGGGYVKFYSDAATVQFDGQFRVPAEVAVKMLAVYARYVKDNP